MVVPKPATRRVRLLFALLIAMATAVAVSAAPQEPAMAASQCYVPSPISAAIGGEVNAEPTYFINASTACSTAPIPDSHACMVVNNDGSTGQGVQCSDVYFKVSSAANVEVWGVGTYYCQGGGIFPCGFIDVASQLGYKYQNSGVSHATHTTNSTPYSCSSDGNPYCPAGKPAVGSGHLPLWIDSQICIEAWGLDLATSYVDIFPNLESDGSNFSSHHVNLCFG